MAKAEAGDLIKLDFPRNAQGKYRIALLKNNKIVAYSNQPLQILFYADSLETYFNDYDSVWYESNFYKACGKITYDETLEFDFIDYWHLSDDGVTLDRMVRVQGNRTAGFASQINLYLTAGYHPKRTQIFVPGMIYGNTEFLPSTAIGGRDTFSDRKADIIIREDRMPAPLFGIITGKGHSIALLNPFPIGQTTAEESHNLIPKPLIDDRFQLGSMGVHIDGNSLQLGYCFPANEGEVTYKGDVYPGGQLKQWRRRFHPVRNGFRHTYTIRIILDEEKSFPQFYSNLWRKSWNILNPQINLQNIALIKKSILTTLASQVETYKQRSGLPNWVDAPKNGLIITDRKAVMGFTGKNLEAARFLLRAADESWNKDAKSYREKALDIINSFIKIKMTPPAATGFNLDTGAPEIALPHRKRIYLRSLGDGFKALACAWLYEKKKGREHQDWLKWMKSFANWLLMQQNEEGGFPRAWQPGTGELIEETTLSSYNAVPFLVLMSKITGDEKYLNSAKRAADVSWAYSQKNGKFVGGTIDNPNVLDKEAATLSLEACLLLYEQTWEKKWLERAKMAANFAETWIYIWNVPMPMDESNHGLQWKKGNSTIGLQLISTGHSLVDMYMSFDADEFAKLYQYTGDAHYLDVARILLHNTKTMTAVPGREYDLRGPGWQQEHWSLAPPRGYGLHRGWLPWVATSQLNGIYGIEDLKIENVENSRL
ncbi:MAG TPA: hypothetical protein ENK44_13605 [Caldithrix abyssi]|uniref:Uncharacterized protein n=1 Tax=Caldithrix abyssi TaxID=187145 RepID=A0A7V4U2C0_CALAY|nr:hypothetical protein [Caldithrix abyssi]